jgi:YesN/AraC family two-component response regulator
MTFGDARSERLRDVFAEMNVKMLLGWIDCTDGCAAHALVQSIPKHWEILKTDAASALQAIGERPPHAIVFDYNVTSKDNLHLLLTVKREHPAIPILMVTEEHSEGLAVWAFRARVWNYFAKPVSVFEFNRNLAQLAKFSANQGSERRTVERPGNMFPIQPADIAGPQALIERVAEVVQRDFASGLRVDDLARSLNLNRFQFNRLFQRRFGTSFRTYVTRLRIESARRLIREAGAAASLTDISLTVGIQDASYFARMFRQVVGESPSAYKRRMSMCEQSADPSEIESSSNDESFGSAQFTG